MYGITDLRRGVLIELDGQVYKVTSYEHSSQGRGGGVVKTKLKNVKDGTTLARTFKGNEQVAPADVTPVTCQYLYSDQQYGYFMRLDNYDQIHIQKDLLADSLDFLTEGSEATLLFINNAPQSVELPVKVELRVVSAEPSVKGDSVGNVTKNCQVESGATIQVPLFIKAGDRILVDTRDGSYLERL